MSELLPPQPSAEELHKQELKRRLISLAKELSQRPEGFPFPGVDSESYIKLKAVDEQFPGRTTHIDEIIKKMIDGVIIVLGDDRDSGNVFALPVLGGDIIMDSLSPHHLNTTPDMDKSLHLLILTQKAIFAPEPKID